MPALPASAHYGRGSKTNPIGEQLRDSSRSQSGLGAAWAAIAIRPSAAAGFQRAELVCAVRRRWLRLCAVDLFERLPERRVPPLELCVRVPEFCPSPLTLAA
jgi:hypothetical protein